MRAPYRRASATAQRFAWGVMALLFAGSVVNYVDRAALGVVMPQIRRDLCLSNAAYGWAVNAFLITYMVFYILGGRLADRLGCRRMFSLSVVFWSAAKMAHFFARGLGSLCFFRALLGIGEGCFYPTAIRGTTEWFAPENRAKGIGVLLCGLITHTDGENRQLLPLYLEAGFDVADSVCPYPMTRCTLDQIWNAFAGRITLLGGIPAVLLCPSSASFADFRQFIDDVIARYGRQSRFILGVSDMVTADADLDRIRYIGEAIQSIRS